MDTNSYGIVYLCGPITGLSFEGATDWRTYARDYLGMNAIRTLSPLRHKPHLSQEQQISDSYESYPLSSQKGITSRDRFDTQRCDLLLVNFVGADKVSIGSCMEIAWADSKRIPIIVVIESGNPNDHAMVRECAGFIVGTLDKGLALAVSILHD